MNELESARRIIDALRNDKVLTLRDLAKRAGFHGVGRDFKVGFNYLQKQGAVKLRQSGWRSEKRGGNIHPKTALLVADVYELENADREIREETGELEEAVHGEVGPQLIPVFTLFGNRSFVGKEEYDAVTKSKTKDISFWRVRTKEEEKTKKHEEKEKDE